VKSGFMMIVPIYDLEDIGDRELEKFLAETTIAK
jgi:hypothetical protein